MEEEKKIPHVFYLYLHSKIFEKSRGEDIKINEVISYMFQWSIPKQLRYLIIKEMERLDLLKITNKYMIELSKPKFNEDEIGKYYCEMSLF
jgi:hypothetical protein